MSNLSKTFKYVNDNGDSITFEYDRGYLISKPNGIDSVSVKFSEAQGINQIGTTVQSTNINHRVINVTGRIVGEFQAACKEKLLSVIRPDIGGRFYADDYYLAVHPQSTPTVEAASRLAGFTFSLMAAYPFWQKDESASVELSGLDYKFRLSSGLDAEGKPILVWRPKDEYKFAERMGTQFINVPNRGQLPVPFTVTFFANSTVYNPKIENAVTNKALIIRKTLAAGERLVVEITHTRTYVTSSLDGDCRGALSLRSNLYSLDVGDNVLKPSNDSGDMEVSIAFATEIVGVTV